MGISRYSILTFSHHGCRTLSDKDSPAMPSSRCTDLGLRATGGDPINININIDASKTDGCTAPISGFSNPAWPLKLVKRIWQELAIADRLLHMQHPSETGCSPSVWAVDAARILLVSYILPEGLRSSRIIIPGCVLLEVLQHMSGQATFLDDLSQ